jgi:hypothetical protein
VIPVWALADTGRVLPAVRPEPMDPLIERPPFARAHDLAHAAEDQLVQAILNLTAAVVHDYPLFVLTSEDNP